VENFLMSEAVNNAEKLIGVEVTTSALKAVCLEADGNLLDSHSVVLIRGKDVIPQIVDFVKGLREKFGDFGKVGITFPGLIRSESRSLAFSTYFPELQDINIAGEIENATGLKVFIKNDANAAAFGEYKVGAGRGSRNMFYVTLGIGVGGALIFDGEIWRGVSGFAGEFGYLAIDADGTRLENVASATNIVRRTRQRFHQDSTSSLGDLPEEEITVAHVVRAAKDGDDFAQLMLERTGNYVGMAIAGVINLLNIEKIVIGGEVMQTEHLVLDAIINKAQEFSFKPSFETTQIVTGELGSKAAAIGVALLSQMVS
jgi:glucokinase